MNMALLGTAGGSLLALFGAVDSDPTVLGAGVTGMGASQVWVLYQVTRVRAEWDAWKAKGQ